MDYRVVTPREALHALAGMPQDGYPLACDLETTGNVPADGLDPIAGRIRLVSFYDGDGPAYLTDLHLGEPETACELLDRLCDFPLVFHNAQFDLSWFITRGHFPRSRVYCTAVLARLVLAGNRKTYATWSRPSLANCAKHFLGKTLDKTEQTSDWGKPELTESQLRYAALDVRVLPDLFDALVRHVKQDRLEATARIEMGAIPAVAWAYARGIPFDPELWAVPYAQAVLEQQQLEAQFRREYLTDQVLLRAPGAKEKTRGRGVGQPRLFGYDDKAAQVMASPKQLAAALSEIVGFPVESTADDALAELDHPAAELVRAQRVCATVVKMFGPGWGRKAAADEETAAAKPSPVRHGRLFPGLYQLGTDTGRMSYNHPNVQQVPAPSRHRLGRAFREAFRAPAGRELVVADFSQIELRLVAQIANDRAMREVYARGGDIHTDAAGWVLGVKEPTKHQRQIMKSANFALLYGAGVESFRAYARSKFGLRLTPEQAADIRTSWLAAFPGIRDWHRGVGRDLDHQKSIDTRTLAGRVRFGVDRYSEVLNSPVQGSGADLLKLALARIYTDRHNAPALDWFPAIFIHDEIVLEVPEGSGAPMAAWLKDHMVAAGAQLMKDVPTDASAGVYSAWVKE